MLHRAPEIIQPKTFSLLEKLMSDEKLADFFLVGGTALALQIGHRHSIDLDLFIDKKFDVQNVLNHLVEIYGFEADNIAAQTLIGAIEGVKTDFISHRYALANPLIETEKIRMVSLEDIAAMKLNAISQSGQRLKDFVDVFFLLEKMPFQDMLAAYQIKYPSSNSIIPLRAITYFDDIDPAIDAPVLVQSFSLKEMKKRLVEAVQKPHIIF